MFLKLVDCCILVLAFQMSPSTYVFNAGLVLIKGLHLQYIHCVSTTYGTEGNNIARAFARGMKSHILTVHNHL